jgi:phenylalanyl-tRNA synthetase beta chain
MLELGKPIHTFDAAAVTDGHVVVRAGRPGERLETLDHVTRDLDPDVLLIADPAGPLAIAGVMGGATSEVGDSTTTVIIESAIFDPVSIRRTAFRYALRSEASLRFEKGQEHRLARIGADRTAQLILRWAGGRAAGGVVDTDPREPDPVRVAFRPARVRRLLGVDVGTTEQRALLARVEVTTEPAPAAAVIPVIEDDLVVPVAAGEEAWVAIVPQHRRDLRVEADIAEEVARIRGYETLPGSLPDTPMPGYRPDPWRLVDLIRTLVSARGYAEVVTHALVGPEDHARLGLAADDPRTIRAANPVTIDHSELRRALLPAHLRVLVDNERQRRDDVAVFEIGSQHHRDGPEAVQLARLAILASGQATPPGWGGPSRPVDLGDVKSLVSWLVARIGGGRVWFEPASVRPAVDHPGRTAAVIAALPDGKRMDLGRVGELDPRYLAAYDIRAERVVVADLDLAGLAALVPPVVRAGSPPRFPSLERDLAVVITDDRPAGDVEAVIRRAAGPLLRELRLFDRYQGPQVAPGELSLAYRLRFEPGDHPIEDGELDVIVSDVVRALSGELGARIRS